MIIQTITTSFIVDMFKGVQDLSTDTVKMALYTADANLNASTTVYAATNEVTSANYTAGGKTCTNVTINQSNGTVYISFDNVSWTNVSFVSRGALIYNATQGNKSIAILNFGSDKSAGPNFVVTLPVNTVTTALIRSSS
jgi:hypothetical protein